jgi:sucrose phosphorylase
LRTLADFAQTHLHGVVSGIHLLPFYPWTSDDGFAVKDYFGVAAEYGTWDDLARLRSGFDLMFDAVFNHASAQGEWFQRFLSGEAAFADFFVTVDGEPDLSQVVRPRALPLLTEFPASQGPRRLWTTFSADQVDLNVKNPEVLLKLIEVLLFYVEKGARFIRLDAIAFLWKEIGTNCLHLEQTHRVVQLMRAVLDEVAPGVMLITETNVPHHDNVSYFGDGTNEAQLVYNFALPPLVLHTLAVGNSRKLTRWAQSLSLPSDRVTFFNFLASHDGIGLNPARGLLDSSDIELLVERTHAHGGLISYKHNPDGSRSPYEMNINYFDALSNTKDGEAQELQVARFLCAHAIMFSLQGLPGIYFHSLFGSRGDRPGAETSGIARRINRQKLLREGLERDLADPHSLRAAVFGGMKHLLAARAACEAFAPSAAQAILGLADGVFAVLRSCGSMHVLCLQNVTARRIGIPPHPALAAAATDLISGRPLRLDAPTELAPYEVVWAKCPG